MHQHSAVSKPHYLILDGLRGVAACMVVAFHVFEANASSHFDQVLNHGYLAVDFFFLLSGFVIGYAYDDRWPAMTAGSFLKKRLIRLQPMVVLGMIVGAACFYFQDSVLWPSIHDVPAWKLLIVMIIGATLIPVPTSMDIRGWAEMHPLNGPGWSLFYEYLANILYALVVRRFSKTLLAVLVILSAGFLLHLALTSPGGDLIGGWSLDPAQVHIGLARLLFPFFAGLLLFRLSGLFIVPHAFLICSALLVMVLAMPRIGGPQTLWMNGLYDATMVIVVFPLVILLGAGGRRPAWEFVFAEGLSIFRRYFIPPVYHALPGYIYLHRLGGFQ